MDNDNAVDDLAILRHTNVSRPQVERPSSKRSITAYTEDAAQSRPISGLSTQLLPQAMGASTQNDPYGDTVEHEQRHGRLHPVDRPGTEAFLPSTHRVADKLAEGAQEGGLPLQSQGQPHEFVKLSNTRPTSSRYSGARYSQLNTDVDPPTPGDDGPYLRFALDQLTRDEEVRGSRQYPTDRWSRGPVAPRGEDRALLVSNPVTDDSQIYDETPIVEQAQTYHTPQAQRTTAVERVILPPSQPTILQQPMIIEDPPYEEVELQQPTLPVVQPLLPPQPVRQITTQRTTNVPPAAPETFVAYDPEDQPLKKLPWILRPLFLLPYIILCLLMLGALAFSGAWASTHLGLWGYTAFGGTRWFIFKFLPTIAGMLMLLWLFQIQVAVQRVTPFIAMASYNVKSRTEAPLMEVQPTNFIFPKLYFFRAGQSVVGLCMFLFWLQIFTIPLFASLYNVYYYGPSGAGSWRWTAVQGVVWTLVGLYALLVLALIILALWLWKQHTGLKWVPASLADYIALLDRSNIVRHYDNSDSFRSPRDFRERLSYRSDRLGYWSTSRRANDFFYTIGDEGADVPQSQIESNRLSNKENSPVGRSAYSYDSQGGREGPIAAKLDTEENLYTVRYRYLPWYLRTPFVLLWCLIAIGLFIAYIVVSYVDNPVRNGFHPHLPVAPNSQGFSSTNFFFAFIPATIGQLMFLLWLSIDYAHRRLQPYVNMSNENGATASKSLYLDYPYRLPVSVTLTALLKGDLIVAYFSAVSLVAAAIPILAGGVFMSQFYIPTQEVRVSVQRPAWYTLNALTGVYAISFLFILIGLRKRRLPHAVTTLGEQFSWLYASRVLGEREWRSQPLNKKEMRSRLYSATTGAEKEFDEGRFAYGRFVGRDGQARLGIDRIGLRDRKLPMTQRSFRSPSPSMVNNPPPVVEPPYQEKIEEEEVPTTTIVNNGNMYAQVPPAPVEEKPQPIGVPVEAGPAHITAPVVASTTVETAPGLYDPYAHPQTTGPAGYVVGRQIMPVVPVGSTFPVSGRGHISGLTEMEGGDEEAEREGEEEVEGDERYRSGFSGSMGSESAAPRYSQQGYGQSQSRYGGQQQQQQQQEYRESGGQQGYRESSGQQGYRRGGQQGYRDDRQQGGYRDDRQQGGYRDEPQQSGGYRDEHRY